MILDTPPAKPNPTANERFRVTLHNGKRLYSIEECLEYAEQESQNIWPVKAAEMLRILAAEITEKRFAVGIFYVEGDSKPQPFPEPP